MEREIVSAAAYIFARNENNEWCILCGKRSGNDPRHQGGMFDVPVGMREIGETPAETASRETFEEAGIRIPPSQFGFVEKQPWGRGNIGSNFVCVLNKTLPIGKGDSEHTGFQWLPINNIDTIKWAYGMDQTAKNMINKFISKQLNEMDTPEDAYNEERLDAFMIDDPEGFAKMYDLPVEAVYQEIESMKNPAPVADINGNMPFESVKERKVLNEAQLRKLVREMVCKTLMGK